MRIENSGGSHMEALTPSLNHAWQMHIIRRRDGRVSHMEGLNFILPPTIHVEDGDEERWRSLLCEASTPFPKHASMAMGGGVSYMEASTPLFPFMHVRKHSVGEYSSESSTPPLHMLQERKNMKEKERKEERKKERRINSLILPIISQSLSNLPSRVSPSLCLWVSICVSKDGTIWSVYRLGRNQQVVIVNSWGIGADSSRDWL